MADDQETRRYHHGNLRSALLAASVEEIASVGTAGVSLRALARRAGVSHAAPAHHFGDKRGLFTALAAEGFALLHARTAAELGRTGALIETGMRYIEFALDHPAHFEVMFDTTLVDPFDEDLMRERGTAFDVLYQALRTGTGVADEAEVVAQGMAAWVMVHGIATLWLSGNLPYDRDSRLVRSVLVELAPAMAPVIKVSLRQLRTGKR